MILSFLSKIDISTLALFFIFYEVKYLYFYQFFILLFYLNCDKIDQNQIPGPGSKICVIVNSKDLPTVIIIYLKIFKDNWWEELLKLIYAVIISIFQNINIISNFLSNYEFK